MRAQRSELIPAPQGHSALGVSLWAVDHSAMGRDPGLREPLSSRELKILELAVEGLTNREIGDRLGLAEQTIKNNVTQLKKKLGTRTRVALVLWALEHRS